MKPWYLAYNPVTGVTDVAREGVLIITGRGNRYHEEFQKARLKGAQVLAYWNPFNIPVGSKNAQDLEQWGDTAKVPRWRFGTGPVRSNWEGTEMADIRPGSAYRQAFMTISETMIRKGLFDGFMMDTMGAKPWAAEYDQWPMPEQVYWTTCVVDMAKELWTLIQRINPKFLKIDNNLWDLPNPHPANTIADEGLKYCSGVVLENPPSADGKPAAYHLAYAKRAFGGGQRLLLLVTPSTPYMLEWLKASPDISHVAVVDKNLGQSYTNGPIPLPPDVAKMIGWPPVKPPSEIEQLKAELVKVNGKLAAALGSLSDVTDERDGLQNRLRLANETISNWAVLAETQKAKLATIHQASAP